MPVARKFDWDEARHLRASGMSLAAIARRFGVTWKAVLFAIDDEARERDHRRSAAWSRANAYRHQYDTCACGSRKTRDAELCVACFNAARAERCKHGHEFTPENTRITSAGTRYCRACDRERGQRRRAAA